MYSILGSVCMCYWVFAPVSLRCWWSLPGCPVGLSWCTCRYRVRTCWETCCILETWISHPWVSHCFDVYQTDTHPRIYRAPATGGWVPWQNNTRIILVAHPPVNNLSLMMWHMWVFGFVSVMIYLLLHAYIQVRAPTIMYVSVSEWLLSECKVSPLVSYLNVRGV